MEMSRRDVRRGGGTNRLSKKQSGGSGFSAKSKLKKLGLADDERLNLKRQEMMRRYDFPASDLENEEELSKKTKSKLLPKKDTTNGVDHASVPRKLRSAMKKRKLDSVSKLSSASKRLNRSKTGTESVKIDSVNNENQEMEAKAIVPESMMISKDEKEVAETLYALADMFTVTDSIDNKTCDPFLFDDKETTRVGSILAAETDFTTKADSLEPAVSVLSSPKDKQIDEKPLQKDHNQLSLTGMVDSLDRLKQSSSVNVTDAPARVIETKAATSDIDYNKSNGLALWPGLSSTIQSSSHILSKPSSTKLPPWMDQAVSHTKNASLFKEPLRVRPRNMKNCASHIYICRLIKALQTNQTEQRSSEMSQCRLPDPVTTIVSPPNRFQNPHLLDLHKTHNPKPLQEDKTQLALELSGPHTIQKQSYDFLSLSSSGTGQTHVPFPNSFPQYPISAAYNRHQMQQMSPYLATRFQTAYNANQQQQQQLQKRLWAAQYRPPTNGSQYSKPNLSLNLASIQPIHVASSPRYSTNVSQQQHRLMAAAAAMSMSHHHNNNPTRTVMNRQEHHFPLIYEDTRTPWQLLCNEQS